ncbi:TPA: IS200/IS605 family transposase [Patescibacteria group bacterium]|nr:MAG: Transposase IS200-family protein [Parcubacteria group bacterium GW2011_GWD2_42_14]HCC05115.1 IS200/IS605 family transposase [Patescibacteria group bacterium]
MTQSRNHATYNAHYHIVFPVKYRKALLDNHITKAIRDIATEISSRYDIEFDQIGCDINHIHLLVTFAPKYAGSDVVRIFKSITAKELFKRFPELRKELWGGEFWSDGFYFATVGERGNWNVVKNYIANQGKTMKEDPQLRLLT